MNLDWDCEVIQIVHEQLPLELARLVTEFNQLVWQPWLEVSGPFLRVTSSLPLGAIIVLLDEDESFHLFRTLESYKKGQRFRPDAQTCNVLHLAPIDDQGRWTSFKGNQSLFPSHSPFHLFLEDEDSRWLTNSDLFPWCQIPSFPKMKKCPETKDIRSP